ncbi:hypothetical protein JVU11DRAFT_3670 [Chiua virens]|nr:hypothetical protein JVU11DRAFT_3670 [Chiua virens]
MGFQLPELPAEISTTVYYGAIGLVVAIVILAKLCQGPNVSKPHLKIYLSGYSKLVHFPQLDAFPNRGLN